MVSRSALSVMPSASVALNASDTSVDLTALRTMRAAWFHDA